MIILVFNKTKSIGPNNALNFKMKIEEIVTKRDLMEMEIRMLEKTELLFREHLKPIIKKEWLTTREVQEYFGLASANTLQNFKTKYRAFKPAKLGGKNLYHLATITKHLNDTRNG